MEDLGKFEQVLETEALVFIVPILIELLADKDVQDKQSNIGCSKSTCFEFGFK